MKDPFNYTSTDTHISIRYGIWHPENKKRTGSIILLGGRGEFMEKYAETIEDLNRRGYRVYSFDWRGQGLSTRMLENRHKGHVGKYEDYLSDLDIFIRDIVKPEAVSPIILLAHSMGAHIALRYIHDHPGVIERAVLTAPMIDILTTPSLRRPAEFITRVLTKVGIGHVYTVGSGDYSPPRVKFEGNRLTSDPERFMDAPSAIAENPDLAIGGVTFGWISATFDSIHILNNPGYAAEIKTPILIVSAGEDRIVSIDAQREICALIPDCRFRLIENARHEIPKESDAIRSIFWNEFDAFVSSELTS
ncbi:alpha/beta fold hydrolase [Thermodesulfobacteriota bacterium]